MSQRLRTAWLSPFGPRSDIGAFSRCVVSQLLADETQPAFECDLFINKNGPSYRAGTRSTDIPSTSLSELLSGYDATFFNIGNNVENHGRIINLLHHVPGVAIVHDFSYHHYFANRCFEELRSRSVYARLLHEYHGSDGLRMALRSGIIRRGPAVYAPWDGDNVAQYPLLRPLIAHAAALVVHSRFMEECVSPIFSGPILRLFLPSDQKQAPAADNHERWRAETIHKPVCRFVTFGHISRSKCLDVVLAAMAESALLRNRAHLTIAGYPGDKKYIAEIQRLIHHAGLSDAVTLEFSVTNERLRQLKGDADAFVNLRFPNTEGASGSLVEMLNAGKPVIAYNAGCYAELPKDAAILVERMEGVPAVARAMESLACDPDLRVKIGAAGKQYLHNKDSREYVKRLKQFIQENRDVLKRRARYVAPASSGCAWDARDITPPDSGWFADLLRARRNFELMEHDPYTQSPDIFFEWSAADLALFITHVLLHARNTKILPGLLLEVLERIGRQNFYILISKVRYLQSLCERTELGSDNFSVPSDLMHDMDFWSIALELQTSARLLYPTVLARGYSADEWKPWASLLRDGVPPAALLLEFLASAECRHRLSADQMEPFVGLARRQIGSSARANQVAASPCWRPGEVLNFSEAGPVMSRIFPDAYSAEKHGRWSKGCVARLTFATPPELSHSALKLIVRARVAGTGVTGNRTVNAYCGDTAIGAKIFENDEPHEWEIEIPPSPDWGATLDLYLVADRAFCPMLEHETGDPRLLGIMLQQAQLDARPAQSAGRGTLTLLKPPDTVAAEV